MAPIIGAGKDLEWEGSSLVLELQGKAYTVLVKKIQYNAMKKQVDVLDVFHANLT